MQRVGFVCFLFVLFYSSTYISSDARWRNSRQQVPRQTHRQTKAYHRTINTTQAHRPSSKSEEKSHHTANQHKLTQKTNSRSSNCLFATHMQTSSQFRKPSSPLNSKHPKYITSQQCATIGCTRQEVGFVLSTHSLDPCLWRGEYDNPVFAPSGQHPHHSCGWV